MGAYPMACHHTCNFGIWLCRWDVKTRACQKEELLTNSGFRFRDVGKLNDTHSFGTGALEQNLCELNLTSGFKEFDQVFVGG